MPGGDEARISHVKLRPEPSWVGKPLLRARPGEEILVLEQR